MQWGIRSASLPSPAKVVLVVQKEYQSRSTCQTPHQNLYGNLLSLGFLVHLGAKPPLLRDLSCDTLKKVQIHMESDSQRNESEFFQVSSSYFATISPFRSKARAVL